MLENGDSDGMQAVSVMVLGVFRYSPCHDFAAKTKRTRSRASTDANWK